MGKLLIRPMDVVPGTVNLLGCNIIDWTDEAETWTETWLSGAGFRILSRWGVRESTMNMRLAASASVNFVVHSGGLRLAQWMEAEFGTPYIAAAPFGAAQCGRILEDLRKKTPLEQHPAAAGPAALVIGEQLFVEALRAALLARGFASVQICGFYDFDNSRLLPGDRWLGGEDDLAQVLNDGGLRLIVGSVDYRTLAKGGRAIWVPLASHAERDSRPVVPLGDELDQWLEPYIRKIV
jgi:hypothetical protein